LDLKTNGGADIYAIGVQECSYNPKKAKSKSAHEDWDADVAAHFAVPDDGKAAGVPAKGRFELGGAGDPNGYVLLKSCSLWEIRLSVLARRSVCHRISAVEQHTEATGAGHVMGNKGGAAIALAVDDLAICFVSSHLVRHHRGTRSAIADAPTPFA
jgi:hypothetical protein